MRFQANKDRYASLIYTILSPETNTAQLHVVAEDADTTAQIEDKSTALSDDSSTLVEEVPQQKQELYE